MAYLIANTISRFGDSLDEIAYVWMVYNLTGSIALMSTLFIINAGRKVLPASTGYLNIPKQVCGAYRNYREES